ncbi:MULTISPECIES: hypothetical protein [Vibrio]|uniref:hypothetical protein n=1 Tax=Vibrio TaxID=662 RepID=UPI0002C1674C|nr:MULTISPECIES: hypothetical protein [Vibrio]EGR0625708.1 hypothetical protein [Vibrio cholerae]EGR1017270.1 hypothetical protein [Vibrio cholerae]EGR2081319.1 hypothetical protein [Vibrio cholerae]EGR4433842.1 hypothetical protein [Vibrio cholerae]EIF2256634.1 hypothetical protein [Vibrio cholerae]
MYRTDLEKTVSLDDIEMGLNHLSDMATELHDNLIKNDACLSLAPMAERLAYMSWMMTRLINMVEQEETELT